MFDKRGQITIFIIVGLLIIASIIFIPFYKQTSVKSLTSNSGLQQINPFVDDCIKNVAENGIYSISLQGGYYQSPALSKRYFNLQIPYYWYNQTYMMPSKETIQQELSKYVNDNLPGCLDDFGSFKNKGYIFELGNISSDVTIGENAIDVNVEYPIIISKGNSLLRLDKFSSTFDFDFNKKYGIVSQFMDKQKNAINSIPLGSIVDLAYSGNFTFEDINMGNGEIIYTFIFDKESVNPFIYAFAARYSWNST